jgi:hypothetical protein
MNLLEYLVQQIQKSSPSLMDLNDELSHLEAASRGESAMGIAEIWAGFFPF